METELSFQKGLAQVSFLGGARTDLGTGEPEGTALYGKFSAGLQGARWGVEAGVSAYMRDVNNPPLEHFMKIVSRKVSPYVRAELGTRKTKLFWSGEFDRPEPENSQMRAGVVAYF